MKTGSCVNFNFGDEKRCLTDSADSETACRNPYISIKYLPNANFGGKEIEPPQGSFIIFILFYGLYFGAIHI
jgi:hypothetical protein